MSLVVQFFGTQCTLWVERRPMQPKNNAFASALEYTASKSEEGNRGESLSIYTPYWRRVSLADHAQNRK